jgi:hypothetical protein
MNGKSSKNQQIKIVLVFLLVSLFFTACQVVNIPTAAPTTNIDVVGTMVAATLTALPSATPQFTSTQSSQTYSNPDYGFAFDYPPGWEVTETVVPPGTTLSNRSMHRYDINVTNEPILLIDLMKGADWILELVAYPQTTGACPGGMGSVPDDQSYQHLQILGRQAARLRVEDGLGWNPPERAPLSTLPIMYYKLSGECAESWPDSSIPAGEVVFLFGYSHPERPFALFITYYSNQFTDANLQNRNIDYAVVREMDQIVQSLRLTR